MNYTTLGIGVAALLYGVYTFFLRFTAPEKLGKLEAMKERWGAKTGMLIHFAGYTVAPIIVGIAFIIMGITGQPLF